MPISVWVSFLTYTILTALSPGPNNILAINATMSFGIKKSQKLLYGIYAGFTTIMIFCGTVSHELLMWFPNITEFVKYLGVIYILWLAFHIANSRPTDSEQQSENSFWKGFILQFVNIKIILWGLTAFNSFIFQYYQGVLGIYFFILLSLIGNGATYIWALIGTTLGKLFNKYWHASNLIMAGLLALTAVELLFS